MTNTDGNGLSSVYERFLALETGMGLMKESLAGVRAWPLVRFFVFSGMVLPATVEIGAAHPDMTIAGESGKSTFSRYRQRISSLLSRVKYGPGPFARPLDVLFSLVPRTVRDVDGATRRQMLDFFVDDLGLDYGVLDIHNSTTGFVPPPRGERAFRICGHGGRARAFTRSLCLDGDAKKFAEYVQDAIARELGVAIDAARLAALVKSAVGRRHYYNRLFHRWLERLRVKCVVTVVNYARPNMMLCEAAHQAGIPVVELQHGTVYPAHPAYNLPCLEPSYSPDYLFSWGSHWSGQTRNYALKGAIDVGSPALEHFMLANRAHGRTDPRGILFISQGTIGRQLSKRAVELNRLLSGKGYRIMYKLHPNETRSWRELYPELRESGVEVITSADRSIYALFSEVPTVVGVYSTAMLEASMWKARGFVFCDLPGGDTMRPFLRDGMLESVSSAQELAQRILSRPDGGRQGVDGTAFWKPDAARSTIRLLNEIAAKGEIK